MISTTDGLRSSLRRLGLGEVLIGLDFDDDNAKKVLEDNIHWWFVNTKQTANDVSNRDRALELVGLYKWNVSSAVSSLSDIRALLEEEQILEPVEVVDIIEDDEGKAHTIEVIKSMIDRINSMLE